MGLVAMDLNVHNLIHQHSGSVLSAIQKAAERLDSGAANAAARRWFGDDSAAFRKDLAKRLRKMRSVINIKTIRISFEAMTFTKQAGGGVTVGGRNVGENASAWNDGAAHLNLGDNFAHVGSASGITSEVYLNEAFSGLPKALVKLGDGTVDASFWNQGKLETIIHELTHLLLGTADELNDDGGAAYGAERAERLATESADRAKNNAENVAIFIEAVGVNASS